MKIIPHKTKLMLQIEHKFNLNVEELLRQKYVDENKPAALIAKELKIDYKTTIRWLKQAGVYSRRLRL